MRLKKINLTLENETPSSMASAAFAKIPLRCKRYVIHLSVTIGDDTFTLAETGLIAQMKPSCLIVFDQGGGAFGNPV